MFAKQIFICVFFTIVLFFRARQLLGNIEELKDYHKKVILPSLEKAVENPELMRLIKIRKKNILLYFVETYLKWNNQDWLVNTAATA